MLFNSFDFIFLFVPVSLGGYFLFARFKNEWAAIWLAFVSLFFYGYWNPRYLVLLLVSISVNFAVARLLAKEPNPATRKVIFCSGVAFDLALLAYYKYAGFFVFNLDAVTGADLVVPNIILPLGISFFTFTQIAFLVDTYRDQVREPRFTHFVLFVTYFPHLIAGPILHHKEMMPQFAARKTYLPSIENFAVGSSIFIIGLAKKVLIADNLAPLASAVFASHNQPHLIEAWVGVLAYTLQIYFDFSGYSDMAIGVSRLFGIVLPLNFNSPYKSRNIIEFWRHWHMTLSRFLRDYLYISLGGNRRGTGRRYVNLMATMMIGGLWHGAGWTYVIWGTLHGFYLVCNHAWDYVSRRLVGRQVELPYVVSWAITFLAVMAAWDFFRAQSFSDAINIFRGIVGLNGMALPRSLASHAGALSILPMQITFSGMENLDLTSWSAALLALAALVSWLAPNTQQIFHSYRPCLDTITGYARSLSWRPSLYWAAALSMVFVACVTSLNKYTAFIYFQF